jgi:hypothetical protein
MVLDYKIKFLVVVTVLLINHNDIPNQVKDQDKIWLGVDTSCSSNVVIFINKFLSNVGCNMALLGKILVPIEEKSAWGTDAPT